MLELLVRIELTTFSLRVRCSAIEPQKRSADDSVPQNFANVNDFLPRKRKFLLGAGRQTAPLPFLPCLSPGGAGNSQGRMGSTVCSFCSKKLAESNWVDKIPSLERMYSTAASSTAPLTRPNTAPPN